MARPTPVMKLPPFFSKWALFYFNLVIAILFCFGPHDRMHFIAIFLNLSAFFAGLSAYYFTLPRENHPDDKRFSL